MKTTTIKIFSQKNQLFWALLFFILGIVFFLEIALGSVPIPIRELPAWILGKIPMPTTWQLILWEVRLPRALAGIFAGAGLSLGGLLMQTLFRNPLAGPSVLGISAGASLGVAVVVLGSGMGMFWHFIFLNSIFNQFYVAFAAILGAGGVMLILLFVSWKIQSNTSLLLVGLMLGYFTSALVGIAQYFSQPEQLQAYLLWTFGSLAGITIVQIPILVLGVLLAIGYSIFLIKPLNAFLLGEQYAYSMGVLVHRLRWQLVLLVSIMTGIITAFCGPIGFIGITVPHLARMLFQTQSHEVLIPAVIILGAIVLLFCDLIAKLPGYEGALPLSAVTSLLGSPFVLFIIIKAQYGEKLFE